MTDLAFGDRHSRAVLGLGLNAEPKIVRIYAGKLAGSISRQHLLVCLINLIARLHGSVKAIQLQAEDHLVVALPHIRGKILAFEAMASLAVWVNGGRIPVCPLGDVADIVIDISAGHQHDADLYAWGSGWKSWVGSTPASFVRVEDRRDCLGPYFAAALVAGELFKRSKGLIKGRFAENEAHSLWSGASGDWDLLPDGPRVDGGSIPDCYLIGAGAVGQGVVNVLGASNLARAYAVTVDHDHHDKEGTNLNRCFLAGVGDIDKPKVDVVRRYREISGLAGFEFHGTLNDYLVAEKADLAQRLLEKEQRDVYELVISAVDINQSRQDIQGLRPRIVVGGSTDGLRAQSVWYGLDEKAECLGCWNQPDNSKARAMAVEAELRAMTEDQQRQRLVGNVNDLDAALAFLNDPEPRCGRLGEADIRAFASSVSPEFSVSFVSMASAVMTAARVLTLGLSGEQTKLRRSKSIFHFRSLKCDDATTALRQACPHCG
ncbi:MULTISPECIES: ThiF family adenylyltransferase [Rhizobium]|uniref:ThiF family adenylyltransferase n=1 Tax=Rhizobium brockwellii TaxID=3019932 RepID=A0ABU3YY73_9HYPH|nr:MULTISPECIES: ThiF family adenylyltransferase [Rhizobium]MDV4158859.1 ThiF family adenylyltransferase [Rhizobium brockwellii]MDV4183788.1 ThiF family adenylyltransferase [Rhizobium brockwellii]MDV4190786.1 ThiF family adenylyltransferase [Rhizobium brockwellii]NZD54985.1 ThiF family adenylyltransferase [Rhizobium leguminosarum]TAW06216.1 hypothetical protein ELI25_32205 [Rhizobium ruizarguesonis]